MNQSLFSAISRSFFIVFQFLASTCRTNFIFEEISVQFGFAKTIRTENKYFPANYFEFVRWVITINNLLNLSFCGILMKKNQIMLAIVNL